MIFKKSIHKAFTMLELIFVIVIMGIIGKFGVEFIAQSYGSYINSQINSQLQSNSATALELIASRLQYRIKASTIARENNNSFTPLSEYFNATSNILEWVGSDVDGFRGDATPLWSGVIDLGQSTTNLLASTATTNTNNVGAFITALSGGGSNINDAAIYFVNPDALVSSAANNRWGWNMDNLVSVPNFANQSNVFIHPINQDANLSRFQPVNANGIANDFNNTDVYEFYQLAWTAYAVGINNYNPATNTGTLTLWYNYQPWRGENYLVHGTPVTIMENVSSFQFIARESLVKIQVCVKSLLLRNQNQDYSLCKEKTIFKNF